MLTAPIDDGRERILYHPADCACGGPDCSPAWAPQPGPQTDFLSSAADIVVMGGAAYVGKTWAEVYFPLRYINRPGYTAAIYRQRLADVIHPGGLWDEATKLYPALGGEPNRHDWAWRFGNASVSFRHCTDEERVKGSQVTSLLLDEGTHFEEDFVWSLFTRNRSTARGVPAQMLITTNPDADSWLAEFLAWWIDQDPSSPFYGLPIPERAGRVRYLVRAEGKAHWFGRRPSAPQLRQVHPKANPTWVKAVQFIPGKLEHNQIGLRINPGYEGNLAAADPVSVARLLGGNWKIRRAKGTLFKSAWIRDEERAPRLVRLVRGWDLAATEGEGDWTASVLLGQEEDGTLWVLEALRARLNAGQVQRLVRQVAEADGQDVPQAFAWERAGAGKSQTYTYTQLLQGWAVVGETESGPAGVRAEALSAQAAQGRLRLVARSRAAAWRELERKAQLEEGVLGDGYWQRALVAELEAFPVGNYDDQVAAALAAFRYLAGASAGEILTPGAVAQAYEEDADDFRRFTRAMNRQSAGRF